MKKLLTLFLILIPIMAFAEEPTIAIPSVDDLYYDYYPNLTPLTWEGGEAKFGKWRQFFNGYEMGWGVTYNSKWNYQDNTWEPRDSIDERSNICSMLRFNVAEGNVGGNVFEINFAKGDAYASKPDWNSGASYFFYDGNSDTYTPAVFKIHGSGNMDTAIKLCPDEGANPNRINIRNSIDGKFYIEEEEIGSIIYGYPYYFSLTKPLFVLYNECAGIGTDSPISTLDINGDLTLRAKQKTLPEPPAQPEETLDDYMTMRMDKETGDVTFEIHHNGHVKELIIYFKTL